MNVRIRTRVGLLCGVPLLLLLLAVAVAVRQGASASLCTLLGAALASMAAVTGYSLLAARSFERFAAALLAALRGAEETGELRAWGDSGTTLPELDEILEGYGHAATAIRSMGERRRQAYVESVGALAVALDSRDPTTMGHSQRVSKSACAVGRAMGLPAQGMERLRMGAVLHDIGKIAVTDAILRKDGPLTDEETALVQRHPSTGRAILESVQGFADYLDAVEQHHENWDGTGYPQGLRGEETCVEARVIRVADAYDAMTTDRCYRKGMTHDVAIRILWGCSGTHFDPAVVRLFAALPQEQLEEMRVVASGGSANTLPS